MIRIVAGVSLALGILRASPAKAQIDRDPRNDIPQLADPFSLLSNQVRVNRATLAAPGNDVDFYRFEAAQGDVVVGLVAPLANVPVDFDNPDTILKVESLSGPLIFNDDSDAAAFPDPSNEGQGSIFRLSVSTTGAYTLGISCLEDEEFDGATSGAPHSETGDYLMTLARFNPATVGSNDFSDDPANALRSGANPITLRPDGSALGLAQLDNSETDVDFFRVDLQAGQIISVLIVPISGTGVNLFDVPDSNLGLFDANGNMLTRNDDAGDDNEGHLDSLEPLGSDSPLGDIYGSALHALVPADATYFLGVTGFDDNDFDGFDDDSPFGSNTRPHGASGDYVLVVSTFDAGILVPEPSTGVLFLAASALMFVAPRSRGRITHD